MLSSYEPPLALTVIASLFIGLAGLVSIWIMWDILRRRGWRSMMGVMLPVYILNALYLAPITFWTYLNHGRPMGPEALEEWIKERESGGSGMTDHEMAGHAHMMHQMGEHQNEEPEKDNPHAGYKGNDMTMESQAVSEPDHMNHEDHAHHTYMQNEVKTGSGSSGHNHDGHIQEAHSMFGHERLNHGALGHGASMEKETKAFSGDHHDSHVIPGHEHMRHTDTEDAKTHGHPGHNMEGMQHEASGNHMSHMNHDMSSDPHMFNMMRDRPMFATVTVAVCHCGAGCLLGDIVGEWLVYGTKAQINGKGIWPEFVIDYAFALLFGIIFQYFSIAPMSGEYGPKTIYRAVKADFLSLTFFEIGLFGWMAIFQIAIFDWKLQTNNVVYWWMMQIGMFLGHWTAFPINWWLITSGIKEPCA